MEILILPTAAHAERLAARIVADRLKAKPDLVLGCATGRTMEGIYTELVRISKAEKLDYSAAHTFNLDEYVGLHPADPRSYHHYMEEKLFAHVNLPRDQTHLPNGVATDLTAEAASYERRIKAAGGIDLQLLGLGNTGHIGFNEPLSSLMSRTREKALTPQTREQNAGMFGGDATKVPPRALTMGVGTILEAKEVIMVVTGASKAQVLATATEGPITSMISATALQLHPRCHVLTDEAAAEKLTGREHYRWTFHNEPDWAQYQDLLA
ncbi:MAG TPA: glucosamine-6-phosphate deaminase [Trueperaceae bacterium]|jgi:glucosamine-6-phosphate deaminase|nr:glucosamine-6-phosphate deaminase [Trueperaceae bacterium]HRQ10652.1 glucosamine-6-phosphate deaminase [Trueperaceae bacterium]